MKLIVNNTVRLLFVNLNLAIDTVLQLCDYILLMKVMKDLKNVTG